MVLQPDSAVVKSTLDKMMTYQNPDGTFQVRPITTSWLNLCNKVGERSQVKINIQTYFDRDRPRVDEVVSPNVLTSFNRFGRGHELKPAPKLIHQARCPCSLYLFDFDFVY